MFSTVSVNTIDLWITEFYQIQYGTENVSYNRRVNLTREDQPS